MPGPFYIDPTIPAANNDPADDQPIMQTNFANINSYLQVDHTNPGIAGAGYHNQVTFFANNVPSTSPTFPTLFTNVANGVNQLFFYSGAASKVANQYYTSVTSGTTTESSVYLMGGIIMKFGVYPNPPKVPTGGGIVTFKVAFPNNIFNVQMLGGRAATSTDNTFFINTNAAPTKAGFNFINNGASFTTMYYLAIGN